MKKQIKVVAMIILLLTSIAAPTVSFAKDHIEANVLVENFSDVNKNHYAYEAIKWAQQRGIVSGYPDGTFRPNAELTESQFAKMLAEFLAIKDNKGDIINATTHWSDRNYDSLAGYGVPLNGYFDTVIRNKPVKRGVVAQAISHLTGNASSLTDAINYMVGEEITTGQNREFEGKDLSKFFGSNNNLTRAQVTAFFFRMHKSNIEEATGIAIEIHKNTEGLSLVGLANNGMSKLDNSLRTGKLGSETPDFSGALLPISDSAEYVNVNYINEVISHLSSNTINKIKEKGYQVTMTSEGIVSTNYFTLGVSSEIEKVMKYRFSYREDIDIEIVKCIVKDLSGETLTDADLSQTTKVTKGKIVITQEFEGVKDIRILR